jgi:hypothetical protein
MWQLKKPSSTAISCYVLCGLLLLSFFREPLYFLQPRLWAEEGTVHVQSVLAHGVWGSLFQPHLGYYSFFNNYVTALGMGLLGVDRLPLLTTLMSLVITLSTCLTPLILSSRYWATMGQKLLIVFFSLFIGIGDIWVNTINAQFYLGLFACYVLLADTRVVRGWRRVYVLTLLLHGVLTGITSVVWAPFFFFKYLRQQQDKSWFEWVILCLMVLGLLVQIRALAYLSQHADMSRFSLSNLPLLPMGIIRNLVEFVPSKDLVDVVLYLMFVLFLAWRIRFKPEPLQPALLCLYVSSVFAFLAWEMRGGGRYGYIPAVLIFMFMVNQFPAEQNKFKILSVVLITLLMLCAAYRFFKTRYYYDPAWTPFDLEHAYTNDQGEREIKVFPQRENSTWVIKLPPKPSTQPKP